jgi:hypothetical protein
MPNGQNGFATALKTITAPRAAFEILSVAPTWGWAFLISAILGALGNVLTVSASLQLVNPSLTHQMATNPAYAHLTEIQRHQMVVFRMAAVRFASALIPFVLLISALAQTVILLIFSAIGRGSGNFKTLWASVMNISIPGFGLSLLTNGIIVAIHGPRAYKSALDSFLMMPSLAWFATHAGHATIAFLSTFNPFSIWTFALTALAMVIVARTAWLNAYLASALIVVLGALVSGWGGARL